MVYEASIATKLTIDTRRGVSVDSGANRTESPGKTCSFGYISARCRYIAGHSRIGTSAGNNKNNATVSPALLDTVETGGRIMESMAHYDSAFSGRQPGYFLAP